MKYTFTISFILLSFTLCISQSKRDYNWILGYDSNTSENFSSLLLSFNGGRNIEKIEPAHKNINFVNASISDPDGNLLFYTNGCTVYDATYDTMINGDSIDYNEWYDLTCNNGEGHIGFQNTMILPDPGYEAGYYILHQPLELFDDPLTIQSSVMMYSYVDMNLNSGLGAVTEKNVIYHENDEWVGSSYFSAVLHNNGSDWWYIKTRYNSTVKYVYGIDEEGIFLLDSIAIGDKMEGRVSGGGQAKFTPDGNKYLTYSTYYGLNIYDFDRSTGTLSNHKQYYVFDTTSINLVSLSISPSGQYAYVTVPDSIVQVDLWAADIEESATLVGVINPDLFDFLPEWIRVAQRGPDCKIYLGGSSGIKMLHTINHPDEKGTACEFVQGGFRLPVFHAASSLPHFPNFRINEGDVCDPTVTSVFGLPVTVEKDIALYPNPASTYIQVDIDTEKRVQYTIIDTQGKTVLQGEIDYGNAQLDISSLQPGMYFLQFLGDGISGGEQFVVE